MNVIVSCYSGYRGEETPRSFELGNNKIEVTKILDRWLAPDHRYFKILSADNSIYILRHDVYNSKWDMTFFSKSQKPDAIENPIGVS